MEFAPYQNESDCIQIDELTIENRVDRVSIYGSINLTKDKAGLAAARELKNILSMILAELEKTDLPDQITLAEPETVDNPFS
jgi:hypothetical protein